MSKHTVTLTIEFNDVPEDAFPILTSSGYTDWKWEEISKLVAHAMSRTDGVLGFVTHHEVEPPPFTTWPFENPTAYWEQGGYWVDGSGIAHEIDEMALDYISNILYDLMNAPNKYITGSGDHDYLDLRDTYLAQALRARLLAALLGDVTRPRTDR